MKIGRRDAQGHIWRKDVCVGCGLKSRETWVSDPRGRAVMAVVWQSPQGVDVSVSPFAWLKGVTPPGPERSYPTVEQAFPAVSVGRSPRCPTSPEL